MGGILQAFAGMTVEDYVEPTCHDRGLRLMVDLLLYKESDHGDGQQRTEGDKR